MTQDFKELMRELKARTFRPIYFLEGEESWFIDEISNFLEKNVLSEAEQGFNQLVMYGKDSDVNSIVSTARRYPMMASHQVVIVKEAQFLRDIEKLSSYIEQPMPSTVLVLNYKQKKLDGRKKLGKLIKKSKGAVLFTAKKLYDNQVPSWIKGYVTGRKYKVNEEVLQLLAENLGNNISNIANELDKLFLNTPKGSEITPQMVEEHIGINRDYNIFQFQKALALRETSKAFRIVSYFAQNPKIAPIPLMMGTLYKFYSNLYLMHHHPNYNDRETQQLLGLSSPYFVKEYRIAARNYPLKLVTKNLSILLQYDLKYKGVEQFDNSPNTILGEMTYHLLDF